MSENDAAGLGITDTILGRPTFFNSPEVIEKYRMHDQVYADYYFLMIGNKLLELGIHE